MSEKFISETIKPVLDTCDTKRMSIGMPGLPKEFVWRGEQYARKQWFEVKTAKHGIMKIYFNRSSPGRTKEMGWWLYTINV
jgi:hypothetical protein